MINQTQYTNEAIWKEIPFSSQDRESTRYYPKEHNLYFKTATNARLKRTVWFDSLKEFERLHGLFGVICDKACTSGFKDHVTLVPTLVSYQKLFFVKSVYEVYALRKSGILNYPLGFKNMDYIKQTWPFIIRQIGNQSEWFERDLIENLNLGYYRSNLVECVYFQHEADLLSLPLKYPHLASHVPCTFKSVNPELISELDKRISTSLFYQPL